ncbi:MAG: ABC transporter permease [Ilumatobacter coccineus]|uniref:ABC transporter permease n=1 Tax=Ilumatobacter coccineus TaxID=467094 RepID=A0A2G6K999_9ACTN|nr:MAG: ABC transporter permease [Ilumatobacter coccineus]
MTSPISFAPMADAAPPRQRVIAHAQTEARLIFRVGEQILVSVLIPIAVLVAGTVWGDRLGLTLADVAPSVLALVVWSTALTSLAITTGFERRHGILERLAVTPLGRGGLLAGKALAITAVAVVEMVLVALVAIVIGWRPQPDLVQWLVVAVTLPLAAVAFASLALSMAGRLQPEIIIGLVNVIYLAGMAGGGIIWPLDELPSWLSPIIGALPTAALGEALRHWSTGGVTWWTIPVAAVWAAGGLAVAKRLFRWTA